MVERLNDEIVASYSVSIFGVKHTRAELAKLSQAITHLREARYSESTSVTEARFPRTAADKFMNGKKDIFATVMDNMEGRIQGTLVKAMAKNMALGKRVQTATLRAAVTKTGIAGESHGKGRRGPGRDDSGKMIAAIKTNVETQKYPQITNITGWHGWSRGPGKKVEAQEFGTKGRPSGQQPAAMKRTVKKRHPNAGGGRGVPAANSLGSAIIVVRESLKRDLNGIKKK